MIYVLLFIGYILCSILTWCLLCGGLSWAYKNIWTHIHSGPSDYILTFIFSIFGPIGMLAAIFTTTCWMERPRLAWTINTEQ